MAQQDAFLDEIDALIEKHAPTAAPPASAATDRDPVLDEVDAILAPYEVHENEREATSKALEVGKWPGDESVRPAIEKGGRKAFDAARDARIPQMRQVRKAREAEAALHEQESFTNRATQFAKSLFGSSDPSPLHTPTPRSGPLPVQQLVSNISKEDKSAAGDVVLAYKRRQIDLDEAHRQLRDIYGRYTDDPDRPDQFGHTLRDMLAQTTRRPANPEAITSDGLPPIAQMAERFKAANPLEQGPKVGPDKLHPFERAGDAEPAPTTDDSSIVGMGGSLPEQADLTLPEIVVRPDDQAPTSPSWLQPGLANNYEQPEVLEPSMGRAAMPTEAAAPPQTTIGQDIAEAANNFMRGFADVSGSALKSIAIASKTVDEYLPEALKNPADIKERMTYKIGQAVQDMAAKAFPTDPARQMEFIGSVLPRALGSMSAFLVGGIGGAVAKAPMTTTALMGAGAQGTEQFEDAAQHGADPATQQQAFWMGVPVGATEAIPIGGLIEKFNNATGGRFMHILKTAGVAAAEEFAQEFFQTTAGNVIAKDILEYDTQRSRIEGATEAGEAGGAAGAILGILVGALGGRRAMQQRTGAADVPAANEPLAQGSPASASATVSAPPPIANVPAQEQPAPVNLKAQPKPAEIERAKALIKDGALSAAQVQQNLKVGYPRAARIVEELKRQGLVQTPAAVERPAPIEQPAPQQRPKPVMKGEAITPEMREAMDYVNEYQVEERPTPVQRPIPETKAPKVETKGPIVETPAPQTGPPSTSDIAPAVMSETQAPVDIAANEAATSPKNDKKPPTLPQIKAGNYEKGHETIMGLDLSFENPAGSTRSGTDKDGKPWSQEMQDHYGYIRGTKGKDKDHIDVFVAPETPKDWDGPVYVVDQVDPSTGKFDEHKVILGARTLEAAKQIYKRNYAKDWKGMGEVSVIPNQDYFKKWLKEGNTTKPFADYYDAQEAASNAQAALPVPAKPAAAAPMPTAPTVSPEGQSFIDRFKAKGFISGTVKSGDADRLAALLDAYKLPYEQSGKGKITFKHLPGKPFLLGGYHPGDTSDGGKTKADAPAAAEPIRDEFDYTATKKRPTTKQVLADWKKAGKPKRFTVEYGETYAEFEFRPDTLAKGWDAHGNGAGGFNRDEILRALQAEHKAALPNPYMGLPPSPKGELITKPLIGNGPETTVLPAEKPAAELPVPASTANGKPEVAQEAEAAGVPTAIPPESATLPAMATDRGPGSSLNAQTPPEPGREFRTGERLPKEYVYHNTTPNALEAIEKEGFSAGSFADRPIDFGGSVWIAARLSDLPKVQSHSYGDAVAHEPSFIKDGIEHPLPPERLYVVDKRGKVIRRLRPIESPNYSGSQNGGPVTTSITGTPPKDLPSHVLPSPAAKPAKLPTEAAEATTQAKLPDTVPDSSQQAYSHAGDRIAHWVANRLESGSTITAAHLFKISDQEFGGTTAEGKYTPKDAYDALELGVNKYIAKSSTFSPDAAGTVESARAIATRLRELLGKLPTQTRRTEEQVEFQQFSTPPDLAFLMAWASGVHRTDTALEPSAGLGGLAIFAHEAGAKVVMNEYNDRRAALLKTLNIGKVYTENAEQLDNILPDSVKPTVVIMNPPFSATAGRIPGQRKTTNGLRHLEQALDRLEPGGRLVALIGKGKKYDDPLVLERWIQEQAKTHAYRARIGLSGKGYKKYGTAYDNQILIFDKITPDGKAPIIETFDDVLDAIPSLKEVRDARSTESRNDSAKQSAAQSDRSPVPETRPSGSRSDAAVSPSTASVGSREGKGQAAESGLEGSGAQQSRPSGGKRSSGGTRVSDSKSGRSGESTSNAGATPQGNESEGGRQSGDEQPGSETGSGSGSRRLPAEQVPQKLEVEKGATPTKKKSIGDSVYEEYTPAKFRVKGAKPHPGKLVESAALAAVEAPDIHYRPHLPQQLIERGTPSLAQLEAIAMTGQAHEQFLPNGDRKAAFLGDGPGVGKGLTIASIIMDNWNQGRKKAVWLSETQNLYDSAVRDWSALEGKQGDLYVINNFRLSEPLKQKQGVMFMTYSTLGTGIEVTRSGEMKNKQVKGGKPDDRVKTRLDQLTEWLGPDYDGVIVFDEAHNMQNALGEEGEGGIGGRPPAARALAGVELQKRFPKARFVYSSATGATKLEALAYAERLGLWGQGTSFPKKDDFLNAIGGAGLGAMEIVAQNLKANGVYISRNLSYDGVQYEKIEHELSDDQKEMYNTAGKAWQVVLRNINDALKLTGVTSSSGRTKNRNARAAAMGKFRGTQLRFYNQILNAMQMPSVLKDMDRRLAAGESVVVQLTKTNEAGLKRELDKMASDEEADLGGLDVSPKQDLIEYVRRAFPVTQYEDYQDADGNIRSRPAQDANGQVVENREAVRKREALIERLEDLRIPDGPLDQIINKFGPDRVAEITGRSTRVIRHTTAEGKYIERPEKGRTDRLRKEEVKQFMAGKRDILVFSEKGGTGESYHADLTKKNTSMRNHYLVEPGWRADKAVQGLGRTNRTNQKQPPRYILAMTNIKGHKRFLSTIARRLDQLGALTKGQRQAGSSGLLDAKDNLENIYATRAIQQLVKDVHNRLVPDITMDTLTEKLGLDRLIDSRDKRLVEDAIPDVPKFMNRLLTLEIDEQNRLFDEFYRRMEALVEIAAQKGELDTGMETYRAAKGVRELTNEEIYRDPTGGARVNLVTLEATHDNYFNSFETVSKYDGDRFVKNRRTGKVWSVADLGNRTKDDGRVVHSYRLVGHVAGRYQYIDDAALDENYEGLDKREARKAWEAQIAAEPQTYTEKLALVTGSILNVWNKLTGFRRIVRMQTVDGNVYLGVMLGANDAQSLKVNLGAAADMKPPDMSPSEYMEEILENKASLELNNGWNIRRARVSGANYVEIQGDNLFRYKDELTEAGAFNEVIGSQRRYFIPTGDRGPTVLQKLLALHPVAKFIEAAKSGGGAGIVAEGRSAYGGIHGSSEEALDRYQDQGYIMSVSREEADAMRDKLVIDPLTGGPTNAIGRRRTKEGQTGQAGWYRIVGREHKPKAYPLPTAQGSPSQALRDTNVSNTSRNPLDLLRGERGSVPLSQLVPAKNERNDLIQGLGPNEVVQFDEPDAETRFLAAKEGVKPERAADKIREVLQQIAHSTREFPTLPDTAEYSPLRTSLLTLQKQKGIAADRVIRRLDRITGKLGPKMLDLFTRKVILDDLSREADLDRDLPFGLTKESVERNLAEIDRLVSQNPDVAEAVQARADAWTELKTRYGRAMRAIGQDRLADRLNKENYFRHQVLEYAQTRQRTPAGTGKELKSPTGRGFLRQRRGSTLDINANYLQADFEVMAQMEHDVEVAKTIRLVDRQYNIRPELERKAKQANEQSLKQIIARERQALFGDVVEGEITSPTPTEAQLKEFAKQIAMGLSKVRKAMQIPKNGIISFAQLASWAEDTESPANGGARQALKGISGRREFVKQLLGRNFKTWEDVIPEGYTTWQPEQGNVLFLAESIPAQLARQLQEAILPSVNITAEQLRKVMAMGGPKEQYVVDMNVHDTLRSMARPIPTWWQDSIRSAQGHWKQLMLLAPRRIIRYNVRNLTGDADAVFAGNPKAFRRVGSSLVELWPVFFGRTKELTGEVKEWFDRGGFQSTLQAQEMGDLNELRLFRSLLEKEAHGGIASLPAKVINGYWTKARLATDYREAMLRYANYREYLAQMQANPAGRPDNFGASIPENVLALPDLRDRAYKLSNELLGAYDRVSVVGQNLRNYWIPFFSWTEVNFRRYKQLTKNAFKDIGAAQLSRFGLVGAGKSLKWLIRFSALWTVLQVVNNLMFPDEERELDEATRNKPHIIFGRDEKGKILYLSGLGALGDLLSWFGLDEAPALTADVMHGRLTPGEALKNVVKAPINKVVQGITPLVKLPAELLARQSTYPDVFRPRAIQDRAEYAAQQVTLGPEYRKLTGQPSKSVGDELSGLVVQRQDPGSAAYGDWQNIEEKWLARFGKTKGVHFRGEKSTAIRNIARSIQEGDVEAEARWREKFEQLGGTVADIKRSVRALAPLSGVTKRERDTILAGIDQEEREILRRAEAYYKTHMLQVLPELERRKLLGRLTKQGWLRPEEPTDAAPFPLE